MREIRLRAWDNYNKCFVFFGLNNDDYEICSKRFTEVMQFTGLFDKSCKEIWEGDIVKILPTFIEGKITTPPNEGRKGVVIYDDEKAGFRLKGNFLFHWLWRFEDYDFEVLGNVWEHPHILESK